MTPKRSMPLWMAIYRRNETDWRGGDGDQLREVLLDNKIYSKTKRLRTPKVARRKYKGRYLLAMAARKMRLRWKRIKKL